MARVKSHRHYTLTQPETPGLIDNTLSNKYKKNECYGWLYSHWNIQWQAGSVNSGPVSSLITQHWSCRQRTHTDAIFTCKHCMHVNGVGGRRWGSVVLILGHRPQWWPTLDWFSLASSGGVCNIQIWHTASCCAVIQLAAAACVIYLRLIFLSLSSKVV